MAIRFHDQESRSTLPIPGDAINLTKYHPDQQKHRDYWVARGQLLPRDVKPDYLTDAEWDQIKILPGEMEEYPDWDGNCTADCCREVDRGDLLGN